MPRHSSAGWLSLALVSGVLATSACTSNDTANDGALGEDAGDSNDSSIAADTQVALDTQPGPDAAPVTDNGVDSTLVDASDGDTGVGDVEADAPTDLGTETSDAPADTTTPAAVCGNGVVEMGEDCEHVSMAGLTTLIHQVARTFTDSNHCSLRCRAIVYSPFGTDITKLGPANPTDLALDRVLYARVPSNNWNPTTYGGYDYRQYYRIALPVKTRLDVYSMAQTAYEGGKAYFYSTGGTLYTSMELFTFYGADKTTRVGGFTSVRGNADASPAYAEHNVIELPAGTYYLAIATPYWTSSKPSQFTLYTYIEQNPI